MNISSVQIAPEVSKQNLKKDRGDKGFSQIYFQALNIEDKETVETGLVDDIEDSLVEDILGEAASEEEEVTILGENPMAFILNMPIKEVEAEDVSKMDIMGGTAKTDEVDLLTNLVGNMDLYPKEDMPAIDGQDHNLFQEVASAVQADRENPDLQPIDVEKLEGLESLLDGEKPIVDMDLREDLDPFREIKDSTRIENFEAKEAVEPMESEEVPLDSLEIVDDVQVDDKALEEKEVDILDGEFMNIATQVSEGTSSEAQITQPDPLVSRANMERVNDSIVQLMEVTTEGESSVMTVQLQPEGLGTVNVTLEMEEGKLMARILVDNEQAKAMFDKSARELSNNLLKQNINIEDIRIDLNKAEALENNPSFNFDSNGGFNHNSKGNQARRINYLGYNREVLINDIETETNSKTSSISILV